MNRHRFLNSLLATPVGCRPLAACGSNDPLQSTGPLGAPAAGEARSNLSRVAGGDPTVAAAAINAFGADLLAALSADDPTGNLVCSPASIAIALAMALGGAAGHTRDEMGATLHAVDTTLSSPDEEASINEQLSAFQSSMNGLLNALSDRSRVDGDDGRVQLEMANGLWGQAGLTWNPDFLDLLAKQYGAGLETVDYQADPSTAAETINAWIADATRDRIHDLIDPPQITPATRLVLTNAVFLNATWKRPFNPTSTSDQDFTTSTGDVVPTPTMHLLGDLRMASAAGWTAVELPYSFDQLSMVVLVDDGDGDRPTVDDVVAQLSYALVRLSLPTYEVESKLSLTDVLTKLGMAEAFSPEANFSAMTTDDPMAISEVIHQANITVDEAGTEAAAVTVVEVVASGAGPWADAPPKPIEIKIDRPFTFWLRDIITGAVIFTGRVNDPRL